MRTHAARALFLGGLFSLSAGTVARGYSPPGQFELTPAAQRFTGDGFAVSPGGRVAIAKSGRAAVGANSAVPGTINVFADAAAASAGTAPLTTIGGTNLRFFGDLTFAGDDTLLFSENGVSGTVFKASIASGGFSAVAPAGSVPRAGGVAVRGSTVYVDSQADPGLGKVFTIPLAGGMPTEILSNVGAGYLGGLAVDGAGTIYVADSNDPDFVGNAGILLVYPAALGAPTVISLAGGHGSGAYDVVLDPEGDAFVTTGSTVTRVPFGTGAAEQFGSNWGAFSFLGGVDFVGTRFEPGERGGTLFVDAKFADEGNVTGITAVPEPASAVLLLAAAMSSIVGRNKRVRRLRPRCPRLRACPTFVAAGAAAIASAAPARADHFFAKSVAAAQPGTGQDATYGDPTAALDGPHGQGAATGNADDVYNLGVGGSVTLSFDDPPGSGGVRRRIGDGPGADFIVFENALYRSGDPARAFAELMFVEVSSDGTHFARYAVTSATPSAVAAEGIIDPANVSGFAGVHPVLANISDNLIDPFDPAKAGGDAFDLAVLAGDPLVSAGLLDLNDVRAVRLVDVVGNGALADQNGHAIYDAFGGANNGADVDAVAVINGVTLPEPRGAFAVLAGAVGVLARVRRRPGVA